MSISFQDLLTDCLVALGDTNANIWSRTDVIWPWCIEALRTFPILRPMKDDHTNGLSTVYNYTLPSDFREVISVEYPVNQQPPSYLTRKSRLDPDFYEEAGYYDVDHDYTTGGGWVMYISGGVSGLAHIYTQYLANHDVDMIDDPACYISVPDEYQNILIASVMCRAYRERLGKVMQDPTAHTNLVYQLTEMVRKLEEQYTRLVSEAQHQLTNSVVSAHKTVDKYDRVY
jgi:hypothetical protein